ncbi:MAG: hypothetical protein WC076_12685 [Terrimicrobiaceae bacterium]|nr:hypothetical protein [Terrimicrobiaceae bacterium]
MSHSPIAKFSGIFLLLLLANLPGLIAQEVVSAEESLSREIAANWKAFQTQTKTLTP